MSASGAIATALLRQKTAGGALRNVSPAARATPVWSGLRQPPGRKPKSVVWPATWPPRLVGAGAVINVRDIGAGAAAQAASAASAAISAARPGRFGFVGSIFFALKLFEKRMRAQGNECAARPNARQERRRAAPT